MINSDSNSLEELNKIINILIKHIKTIFVITVLTTIIFGIAIFTVIKPKYQSTTEIIVNQKLGKNADISLQQQIQSTDLQLINTYKSILESQTISNEVKKEVGKNYYSDSSMTVNTDVNSQVISIIVKSNSPLKAAKVANSTAQVFKKKIKTIMNVNNVSIISKAQINRSPVFPKKTLSLIFGIILGVVFGVFTALFKEYNDKTITSVEYITNNLGLVDLGTISDIDMKNIKKNLKK